MQQTRNFAPLISALSCAILGLIALAYFVPSLRLLDKADLGFIPALNAACNSVTFGCLLGALVAIRHRKVELHRTLIFGALAATLVFLLTYLVYHFNVESAKYGGEGWMRTLYFAVLLTHIVLAAAIVPLALVTLGRGHNMYVARHRAIARWTMPIWLYVSATGVVVYFMIRPYY